MAETKDAPAAHQHVSGHEHKGAATKAPPPHPKVAEGGKLVEEAKALAKTHKENIAKLREKLAEFVASEPADLTAAASASVKAVATQVEEQINYLDPAAYVKEPEPLPEPEPADEHEAKGHK
jgi:hypothetical protein